MKIHNTRSILSITKSKVNVREYTTIILSKIIFSCPIFSGFLMIVLSLSHHFCLLLYLSATRFACLTAFFLFPYHLLVGLVSAVFASSNLKKRGIVCFFLTCAWSKLILVSAAGQLLSSIPEVLAPVATKLYERSTETMEPELTKGLAGPPPLCDF